MGLASQDMTMVKQINNLADAEKKTENAGLARAEQKRPLRKGNLIVLTGPSGVGKGTLTMRLMSTVPNLLKSVSVTTRERRPQEKEGLDYFYRSRAEFEEMKGSLLEWAEFAGNCYGTPEAWVDEQIALGNDVLLEIEVQGAQQIRKKRPQSLLIFVSPPSFEALRQRLESRATETEDKIRRRLDKAREELTQKNDFHYEVINDDIDEAVNNLVHIVYAERCRIRK
ncbi:MAG: guanylate kinase [Candidatus Obscuribacterales bacterium]|nr:guanylate kinase [Candidatus Obscuribacterales bacterium]